MLFGLIVPDVSSDDSDEIRLTMGMIINNIRSKADPKNEARNVLKNDFIINNINRIC